MTDTASDVTLRLMRELDRLKSENEELREKAEVLCEDYEQMRGYYDEADGEKARLEVMVRMHGYLIDNLRELVWDILSVIEDSEFDPMFERQGKRGPYYVEDPSWRVGIRDRARQLGVRVDG